MCRGSFTSYVMSRKQLQGRREREQGSMQFRSQVTMEQGGPQRGVF